MCLVPHLRLPSVTIRGTDGIAEAGEMMRECESGCSYGISSRFGGSLLQRRCVRCGRVEFDLREASPGVMALFGTIYGPFVPDLDEHQLRRGALN